ncbi:MAG: hypothetical protein ACOC6H_04645 [Thermoproteota archaeon]
MTSLANNRRIFSACFSRLIRLEYRDMPLRTTLSAMTVTTTLTPPTTISSRGSHEKRVEKPISNN